MPTVEIIAVNAGGLPPLPNYTRFVWRGGTDLISDRSLFQHVLDRLSGAIVHLGDGSDHPTDPAWFCGHIIKSRPADEDWHEFQFDDEASREVADLLQRMQEASPDRYVVFLTDFQFGPDEALERDFETLPDLWAQHDSQKLRHNTLYHVGRPRSSPNQTVQRTGASRSAQDMNRTSPAAGSRR